MTLADRMGNGGRMPQLQVHNDVDSVPRRGSGENARCHNAAGPNQSKEGVPCQLKLPRLL